MKNNNTKKSLKTSAISLLLCSAMLVGTTFAWFTDSITNKGNVIQSGNLDIGAIAYDVGTDGMSLTIPGVNNDQAITFESTGSNLEEVNEAIINEKNWEPGISNAKLLEVTNKGSLATNIKLDFTVQDGGLQDALWFDFVMVDESGNIQGNFEKRPMKDLVSLADSVELPLLNKDDKVRFVLVYGMNEEAGNEFQGKSFNANVAILAKQATQETDGFGNSDYDVDAEYAKPVFTADEFVAAAQEGGSIKLEDNITLENEYLEVKKDLTIIGNGKTLKSPTSGEKKDRVINVADTTEPVTLTLQNVNIEGPTTGSYNRGISFYNTSGEVNLIMDNCSVSTNYYALNIASQCSDVNVTIKNSTLSGYAAVQMHSSNTQITLDNCVLIGNNSFEKDEFNNFATVVINQNAENTILRLNNCTIKANNPTGNKEYYLSVRSQNNSIELNNCKYILNNKEQSLENAMGNVQLYSSNNSIKVDGVEMVKK